MKVFAVRDALRHSEQARQLAAQHQALRCVEQVEVQITELHYLFAQLGHAYEVSNVLLQTSLSQQTLVCLLGQFDKRFS